MDRRLLRLVPATQPPRTQTKPKPGLLGFSKLEARALLAVLAALLVALVLYDVGVLLVYDLGV